MQAVSVNPTVVSLTRTPAAEAVPAQDRAPSRRDRRVPASRMLVHTVRRALATATDMAVAETVITPVGPVVVDVVLKTRFRRVAVVVGEEDARREAMVLVYGGFDALYRVSAQDASGQSLAVVTLLEESEPIFFSGDAARLSAATSVRRVHRGRTTLAAERWDGCLAASLHRRRLNRPGEWAHQFELALDAPARQAS